MAHDVIGASRDRVFLQVERDNVPAQALYASMGFRRSHGYRFRSAP